MIAVINALLNKLIPVENSILENVFWMTSEEKQTLQLEIRPTSSEGIHKMIVGTIIPLAVVDEPNTD